MLATLATEPTVPSGRTTRLRASTPAIRCVRLYETLQKPVEPGTGDRCVFPPGALAVPPRAGGLPFGYRTKYISFANTATADILLTGTAVSWVPLGPAAQQPQLSFALVSLFDDECGGATCAHEYYNLQGSVVELGSSATELLRSNLQAEYR